MKGNGVMKEVLFCLVDDALYVANGGDCFTRQGVIGICASHLSEKHATDSNSDDYRAGDRDLISAIQSREIETYKNDKNRLTSDARAEQEISRDYGGRFVWELLQNADDVMGPAERRSADLIGTKGLGFKSVLEITEAPEIHSGPFHFKFSPDETRKLLKCEGINNDPPRLTFRIPHPCQPADKARRLLEAGYSTVIRLPFRDGEARKEAKDALEGLEPYFLLLSQELESVHIILDGEKRCFRVERETQGFSDGRAVLHSPDGTERWKRWVETKDIAEAKRLTAAIALPIGENGKAVPHAEELPFHVFFPTEEELGVKALLHASFALQQNRKYLRDGNHDTELLDLFSEVLKRVILDVSPETALKTFGSTSGDDTEPIEKIKQTIRKNMRTTPFVPVIGGGKVSPPDSTVWEDELGKVLRTEEQEVKDAALVRPKFADLFEILKNLGAEEIEDSEYVRLLHYCRNRSLEYCIASFRVLVGGGLMRVWRSRSELLDPPHEVPCWWTESEQARPLYSEPPLPLLWEKPERWPDWLPADSLHPEFRTEIEKWEDKDEWESLPHSSLFREEWEGEWERLTNGFLLRKEEDYIDLVLIPCVKEWNQKEWERRGFNALKLLALWERQRDFNQTEPCIKGEKGRRNTLAAALHLPTDKGWLPAIDCFAGKDWDGPEAFDDFFKDRNKIGIVQPFEKWPRYLQKIDKNKWKGLLRWIGVSWEPKVCQTQDFTIPSHQLWGGYSGKWSDTRTLKQRGHNYLIQDFPDCISQIEKKELVQHIFPALFKLTSKNARRYWSCRTGRICHYTDIKETFALEQLRKEAWLPVKKSLLGDRERIPPSEAFLPNKGLNGLLPEVDRSDIENKVWEDDIKYRLCRLGVVDNLPNDAEKWHDLLRRLAKAGASLSEEDCEAPSDWKDGKAKKLWQAARSLYREYLQKAARSSRSYSFPSNIKIACICWKNNRRILTFSLPKYAYWIDKPYLADLTLENELLSQGYELFIFRLQDADKSEERFGVHRLSDAINCRPRFIASNNTEKKTLSRRYKDRRVVLEKVMKIKLPETVAIKAVRDLVLELSTNGQSLGRCSVHSWREERTNSILVDIERNKWRSLADALAHRLPDDESYDVYTFEVYLADDDNDSVLGRARDAGVPEEALEEMKTSFQQPQPNEQPEEAEEGDEEHDGANTDGGLSLEGQNKKAALPSKDRKKRGGHQRSNGENQTGELHTESGLEAEEWLGKQLGKQWPNDVEKVHTGRDFTLSVGGRTVHIEAKHVENRPGAIHWSDRQYERAEETSHNEDAYFIAVLSPDPDGKNEYSVHWIWDPLEHMKDMDRNVTWSGRSEPNQLQTGDWNVGALKPQSVPSKNFSIEVKLTGDVFDKENQDGPYLEQLRAKVENLK